MPGLVAGRLWCACCQSGKDASRGSLNIHLDSTEHWTRHGMRKELTEHPPLSVAETWYLSSGQTTQKVSDRYFSKAKLIQEAIPLPNQKGKSALEEDAAPKRKKMRLEEFALELFGNIVDSKVRKCLLGEGGAAVHEKIFRMCQVSEGVRALEIKGNLGHEFSCKVKDSTLGAGNSLRSGRGEICTFFNRLVLCPI